MSVAEAKEVWLHANGQAGTLTAHQEELAAAPLRLVCPRCRLDSTVTRKVHALPPGLGYDGTRPIEAPGPAFVRGFWCGECALGFVPEHLLGDFGLVKVRPV